MIEFKNLPLSSQFSLSTSSRVIFSVSTSSSRNCKSLRVTWEKVSDLVVKAAAYSIKSCVRSFYMCQKLDQRLNCQ